MIKIGLLNIQSLTLKALIVKGAVCNIVAKTGTAINFKLLEQGIPPPFPLDSRLPDMLQHPAGT